MSVTRKYAHEYAAYLNSPAWGKQRRAALDRAGKKCERCEGDDSLQVHHRTYDRLGHEKPEDLEVLCSPCHAYEHGRVSNVAPIAGPAPAHMRDQGERIYWAVRSREEASARAFTSAQCKAIRLIQNRVRTLENGPLRDRLKAYLRENAHLVSQSRRLYW